MAISKKLLKNNKKLANNISLLSGEFAGKRALVLHDAVDGIEALKVKDFYHLVILEHDRALASVPEPDILVYGDESPYRNGILFWPDLFYLTNTLFISNHKAIQKASAVKLELPILSATFLPANGEAGSTPLTIRKSPAGLSATEPGVHLALVLGCTEIYYTGISQHAIIVDKDKVQSFVDEQDRYTPKNFVGINRSTIVKDFF